MPIPDYQSIMLPLLQYAQDNIEHSLREGIEAMAKKFNLTEQERRQLLPSGQQSIFDNRVGWARTYMKKAGLLESAKRGYFKITRCGTEVLSQKPQMVDVAFLRQFPEFIEFQAVKRDTEAGTSTDRCQTDPEMPYGVELIT